MNDASARRTHAALEGRAADQELDRHLAEAKLVHLPGNVPPWTASGVRVRRGDRVTLLSSGRLVLSEELDLWYGPTFALWARVGASGRIFKGTRDTFSFVAAEDGPLELALYNGEWATPTGELATPREAYASSAVAIETLVLRWRRSASEGLDALAAFIPNDALVAREIERLRAAVRPPQDWRHLWFLGDTEIFADAEEDGRRVIRVDARSDVGILQHPVGFRLGPTTTVSWRWRIDELPGSVAEDNPIAHDYLSLAVEFENGKDLTWYWSAALPPGKHYACPLPGWTARETHWVVRSGAEGLGRWHEESRPIAADYRTAIGEPPARIVAVWLIAVSLFRHGRGRAAFADIVLRDGDEELRIL